MPSKFVEGLDKIRVKDGNEVANHKAGIATLKAIPSTDKDFDRAQRIIKKAQERLTNFANHGKKGKEKSPELMKKAANLYREGNLKGALEVWQVSLSSDPSNTTAKKNIERTRRRLNQ